MLENLKGKKIILGSKSPRRKELLSGLGIDFTVKTFDFDESYPESLDVEKITEYLVNKKLESFPIQENEIIITADTLVCIEGKILEKPKNIDDAKNMLKLLSGNTHKVFTSVGIKSSDKQKSFTDCTKVYFNEMDSKEIDFYVENFSPLDKAGSYGIQEWIGYSKISKIEGSFYTVMGLPTSLLYQELKHF